MLLCGQESPMLVTQRGRWPMKVTRIALLVLGIAAVLIGLIWMGQGSGY